MKKTYLKKLDKNKWNKILDEVFESKKKDIKIDGFRKGQVTKEIFIKKVGIEALYNDAVDKALNIMFSELLKDKDTITPIIKPTVDVKKISQDGLEVEYTLISAPEVTLGKYKDLGVKKETAKATEEEINHEIEHIKDKYAEVKVCDDKAKVKDGSVVVIDFTGYMDNKPFKGGNAKDYELTIGSSSFIPGFETGLIGHSKNEKVTLDLTFPEDYGAEELKGKPCKFEVEIKEIKERIVPELNEEFFKDLAEEGVNNIEDFKKEVKAQIESGKQTRIDNEYIDKCLEIVSDKSLVDIDDEIIEDETEYMIEEIKHSLSHQGLTLENYMKLTNTTMDAIKEDVKIEAKKRCANRFIIEEVVKKEDLKATEEEKKEYIKKNAEKYKMSEKEYLSKIENKEYIDKDIVHMKALKLITGLEDIK